MGLLGRYGAYTRRSLARRPSDLDIYRTALRDRARPNDRVLHLGCGWDRSQVTRELADTCEVIGVDVDPSAADRYHSPFWLTDGGSLPFATASFDVVCSEYVFEHVEEPDAFFAELSRVLRPGGWLVALTPSRWSYKSLIAAATPHRLHELAAGWLRPDSRDPGDVYPTHYLMNSASELRRLASGHGLTPERLAYLNNGPTWFRRMPGLFELGRAYHAVLDLAPALDPLKCGLLVEMRRDGSAARPEGPLGVRCDRCGTAMHEKPEGFTCPGCGRGYPRSGRLIDARVSAG